MINLYSILVGFSLAIIFDYIFSIIFRWSLDRFVIKHFIKDDLTKKNFYKIIKILESYWGCHIAAHRWLSTKNPVFNDAPIKLIADSCSFQVLNYLRNNMRC